MTRPHLTGYRRSNMDYLVENIVDSGANLATHLHERDHAQASSLRFVPDVVALAKEAQQVGDIHLATVAFGNGIEALPIAYPVLGRGAVSCHNIGWKGRNSSRAIQDRTRSHADCGRTPMDARRLLNQSLRREGMAKAGTVFTDL